jgi:Lrp/AsnC family transcriptional regulator, leucine-responsive regulatory protein
MRAEGVIVGDYSIVDPVRAGLFITIVVEVQLESERLELLNTAKRSVSAGPCVQQSYYVTGKPDFALIVTVTTLDEYESLLQRLFFENQNVKRFRTFVVSDRIKAGLAIALPEH